MSRSIALFTVMVLGGAPASILGAAPAGAHLGAGAQQAGSILLAQAYPAVIEQTRQIQLGLKRQGYDPGPIDGLMGRRTANAIRAFQRDHGLAVTGMPSRTVYEMLAAAAAEAEPDPN